MFFLPYYEHYFSAVQERNHLFDQSLWRFALRGHPRGTVLGVGYEEQVSITPHPTDIPVRWLLPQAACRVQRCPCTLVPYSNAMKTVSVQGR